MEKLYYPAVFQKEITGYSVWLHDISGCISQGETFEEAVENITDALGLFVEEYRSNGDKLPAPTLPYEIQLEEDQFTTIISFDWVAYQKKHNNKAVKKTLTIPSWLNTLAEEQHVNFSGVLQAALKEKLHIAE